MTWGLLPTHGVGGAAELPVPMMFAVVGASWALTLTFLVAALAWRQPRFTDDAARAVAPRRGWLGAIGLLLAVAFLFLLFSHGDDQHDRGVAALYVLVWVGLVPLALLAGHVWRDLSPLRTAQALVGRAAQRPDGWLTYPAALGYWPAAAGLVAFGWLELASPDPGSVQAVRWWVLGYLAITLIGGLLFGPSWFDRADPFDVYSALVAHASPFVRDGRWGPHNPLRSLATVPPDRGLVAVVATLLALTAFDSFADLRWWTGQDFGSLATTLGLIVFCAAAAVLFSLAAMATGGVERRRTLPTSYAHSLIPIAVGYVLAHYLTALIGQGPAILGFPDTGAWVFQHAAALAVLKVALVVTGHLLAVLAAHDCALRVLPRTHRLSGQLAMLLLMVAYTFTGLFLLLTT
ncbi:MAG TPA: hypothetical protein VK948_02360 [Aeromicrobium sp.]|nr:hypothetical protein [Aeromicrobium sp.]